MVALGGAASWSLAARAQAADDGWANYGLLNPQRLRR